MIIRTIIQNNNRRKNHKKRTENKQKNQQRQTKQRTYEKYKEEDAEIKKIRRRKIGRNKIIGKKHITDCLLNSSKAQHVI